MAALFNTQFYKDTRELLELYNRNITFKNSLKRLLARGGVTYKGRPLKQYLKLISYIDSQYKQYVSLEETNINFVFEHFYEHNPLGFQKLEQSIKTEEPVMPLVEEEAISLIERMPEGEEKKKKWEEFDVREEPEEKPQQPQIPRQLLEGVPEEPRLPKIQPSRLGNLVSGGGKLAGRAGGLAAKAATRAGIAALAGLGGGALATGGVIIVAAILIALFIAILVPMFQQQQKDEALLMTGIAHAAIIGGSCPDTSSNKDPNSCRYLNPAVDLFANTLPQTSINNYIAKYSSVFIQSGKGDLTEFTKRTNYIVDNARQAGLNPAIFLGYWKSENNFSTEGNRDMGCAGDNFYEQVDCSLGIKAFADPVKNPIPNCAKSKDGNSKACIALKGIRGSKDKINPIKYPISTFDDFAEAYGAKTDDIKNCTHTYNILIEVAIELNACVESSTSRYNPGGGTGIISCPVNNGRRTTGSKETGGHCSPSYPFTCVPPGQAGYTGRDTAVDIVSSDRNVFIPNLGGNSAQWTIDESGTSINTSEGGGIAVGAFADYNNHRYRIRFVHIDSTNLRLGQRPSSGVLVGTYNSNADHVHVTLQEDGVYKPADLYFNLCQ